MPEAPWYETMFGPMYLRMYGSQGARGPAEAEFIFEALGLSPGARALDLCCGQGRHAVEIAAKGCSVVGLDLSETLLAEARRRADERGLTIEWVHSDMREIPFEAEFDAVYNAFTAWGYFEEDAENQRVLAAVARALKPGGWFLLDTRSWEMLTKTREHRSWHEIEGEGLILCERANVDLARGGVHGEFLVIERDGTRTRWPHWVRLPTLCETRQMLAAAGLELIASYGGYDGSEYTANSYRLITVSRRPM
jgi:SAM-dependent methyltransferase